MPRSLALSLTRRVVTAAVLSAVVISVLPTSQALAVPESPPAGSGRPDAQRLDGFVIQYTPGGIGRPNDFQYEWEDVAFHSRVWETGPDDDGATKVDLTARTIRGAGLTDLDALRNFLTDYHEKDPAEWKLTPVRVGPYGGYATDDEVFFFVAPGLGAEVRIDRSRFPRRELTATVRGFRPDDHPPAQDVDVPQPATGPGHGHGTDDGTD